MLKQLNWRVKKSQLSMSVLGLGSSVFFALLAYYFFHATDVEHTQKSRALASLKTKYQQAETNLNIIDTMTKEFEGLVKKGIIGPENRLQLIETIQDTANRLGIPEINYKISEQQQSTISYAEIDSSQLSLFRSQMSLGFRLLHEEDLFAVLNDLHVFGKGLSHTTQCSIKQIAEISPHEIDPNLIGHCKLTWYTIRTLEEE